MSHYAFVASAGAYKANKVEPALTESDPRKDSAGHVAVEKYLEEQVGQQALQLQLHKPECHEYCPFVWKDCQQEPTAGMAMLPLRALHAELGSLAVARSILSTSNK